MNSPRCFESWLWCTRISDVLAPPPSSLVTAASVTRPLHGEAALSAPCPRPTRTHGSSGRSPGHSVPTAPTPQAVSPHVVSLQRRSRPASRAILVHVPGHEHLDGPVCLSTLMPFVPLPHTCAVGSRGGSRPAAHLPTGPVPGRSPQPAVGSGWASSRKPDCLGFQLLGPSCWGLRGRGSGFCALCCSPSSGSGPSGLVAAVLLLPDIQ